MIRIGREIQCLPYAGFFFIVDYQCQDTLLAVSILASKLTSLGDLKMVVDLVEDMTAHHRGAWSKDPTKT